MLLVSFGTLGPIESVAASNASWIRQLTASDVETLSAALPHYVFLHSLAVSHLELNEKAAKSLMAKCFKHTGFRVLTTYW